MTENISDLFIANRGSGWNDCMRYFRLANRDYDDFSTRYSNLGFRPCRKIVNKDIIKEFQIILESELFNE